MPSMSLESTGKDRSGRPKGQVYVSEWNGKTDTVE